MPITIALRNMQDKDKATVDISGFDTKVADNHLADMFGLQRAAGNHPPTWGALNRNWGRPPNTVWLSDPTECKNEKTQFMGRAYASNKNWRPVTITKTPVSATIRQITTDPKALTTKLLDNKYNSHPATLSEDLGWDVTHYAEVSDEKHWSQSFTLTVGAEVGKETAGYKATFEFSSTTEFGASQTKTSGKSESMSGNSNVSIEVPPYTQKEATLYTTRGIAEFDVEYDYEISGQAYIYYKAALWGKHHHVLNVQTLLGWMNKPTKIRRKAKLTVGMYTDGRIAVANVPQIAEPSLLIAIDELIEQHRVSHGVSPYIADLIYVRNALIEEEDLDQAISKSNTRKAGSNDVPLWSWAHDRLNKLKNQ